jgi:hypothetical protein
MLEEAETGSIALNKVVDDDCNGMVADDDDDWWIIILLVGESGGAKASEDCSRAVVRTMQRQSRFRVK